MIKTINDDVFAAELEKYLKAQNITKEERQKTINTYLKYSPKSRDSILDEEEAKAKEKQKKSCVPLEKSEQIELVQWFKAEYPGVHIMMIRNDGYRTFAERPEQLMMGLLPGASDLYIPAWHCWIEMKRVKGSVWSAEQQKFADYVRTCGDRYLLCYGFEDAKQQIKELRHE